MIEALVAPPWGQRKEKSHRRTTIIPFMVGAITTILLRVLQCWSGFCAGCLYLKRAMTSFRERQQLETILRRFYLNHQARASEQEQQPPEQQVQSPERQQQPPQPTSSPSLRHGEVDAAAALYARGGRSDRREDSLAREAEPLQQHGWTGSSFQNSVRSSLTTNEGRESRTFADPSEKICDQEENKEQEEARPQAGAARKEKRRTTEVILLQQKKSLLFQRRCFLCGNPQNNVRGVQEVRMYRWMQLRPRNAFYEREGRKKTTSEMESAIKQQQQQQ